MIDLFSHLSLFEPSSLRPIGLIATGAQTTTSDCQDYRAGGIPGAFAGIKYLGANYGRYGAIFGSMYSIPFDLVAATGEFYNDMLSPVRHFWARNGRNGTEL